MQVGCLLTHPFSKTFLFIYQSCDNHWPIWHLQEQLTIRYVCLTAWYFLNEHGKHSINRSVLFCRNQKKGNVELGVLGSWIVWVSAMGRLAKRILSLDHCQHRNTTKHLHAVPFFCLYQFKDRCS